MKTKNIFQTALSMTAVLIMTACSSNDLNSLQGPATTIPYTVTVNGGNATTRATVENDHKTLHFAAGDKLYVTGTNISGVLVIASGTGTASATFSGNLNYTGSGSPASDLSLTASLVSAQQTDGTEVSINPTTNAVTVNYPTTAYCTDVATAVQKYSNLQGTSTFGKKSFTLSQQTAFLDFVITLSGSTTSGTSYSAVVSNGGSALCTANVTPTTENNKVVAKFVLPVAANTSLSSANVKLGDNSPVSFGNGVTLEGKVYYVKETASVPSAAITTAPTATTGDIIAGSTTALVAAGTASGGTMMYKVTTANTKPTSTEGFSATVPTAEPLAAGTYYVWYYAKADDSHIDSEISASGIEVTVKAPVIVDLSSLSANYTAKNNEVLTGKLMNNVKISIADGASVTLDNVTIDISGSSYTTNWKWAGITCEGNATIILKDGSTNTVKAFHEDYPGIRVVSGKTLTIKGETAGTGELIAEACAYSSERILSMGAGIGGGFGVSCGYISIQGGIITAVAYDRAAGIGSGPQSGCSGITISGGIVNATGGNKAAGIGTGLGGGCNDITITTGVTKVTATKGSDAINSIGAGYLQSKCGTVTIGGTVYWNGSAYVGTGESYLTNSPLIYQP